MILRFEFNLAASRDIVAFFLDFWAKKSGAKYAIKFFESGIWLFVSGQKRELDEFSDNFLAMVPHSIFLRESKVELVDEMPLSDEFSAEFSLNLLTPNSILNKINEFGFSSDTDWVSSAANDLQNGRSLIYKDYILSNFDNFDCDFLLPTNLNLLPKIFVCDEKSLIALASFEKPVVDLRTNAIFRSAHEFAPLFFKARSAWDKNIYDLCLALKNINFIKVKSKKREFEVRILDDSFLITNGTNFLSQNDKTFLEKSRDKNAALFALKLKELNLTDKTCAQVFFSKQNDDFIAVSKQNSEFNLLKIKTPNSFGEIYDAIRTFSGGSEFLAKFEAKFGLVQGEIKLKNNFYSIFQIVGRICGFKHDALELANDFGGAKGVRIDFKMSSKDDLDAIRVIKSAMNFALAGADPKNISFGLIESLSFFISDLGDLIKDEFECAHFVLCGSLFECKALSNLALKFCNSNFKTCFSEQYPLEIA